MLAQRRQRSGRISPERLDGGRVVQRALHQMSVVVVDLEVLANVRQASSAGQKRRAKLALRGTGPRLHILHNTI